LPRYNFPLIDRAHVFAIDNQAEAHVDTGVVQHTVLMVWRMKMTLIRAVAAWTGWQFD
jgi:hypothetical protein